MRINPFIFLMASLSSASISKEVVRVSASPSKRTTPSEFVRLPTLRVYSGNSSDPVELVLDSQESRSNLMVPLTVEMIEAEAREHEDDESYFPSSMDEVLMLFRIRNSWEGEPDLVIENVKVLTHKYLPIESEELINPGVLAIGPSSAFANRFKSFVLLPSYLGEGSDRRIVKQLTLNPVNPGCDCAGPDYRMKRATAIRVPGIGYTTADVWAVMGSTRIITNDKEAGSAVEASVFRGAVAATPTPNLTSKQARYHISTTSNSDRIPEEIYDAFVAYITAQGGSVSSTVFFDTPAVTRIENCEMITSWPKLVYAIELVEDEASRVFEIVIDESDYLTIEYDDDSPSRPSCFLNVEPARQVYSKPIEDYFIGVNAMNKVAIHFDNVRRQLGFCYSSLVR